MMQFNKEEDAFTPYGNVPNINYKQLYHTFKPGSTNAKDSVMKKNAYYEIQQGWPDIILWFASAKLQKREGKVSATDTLQSLDPQMKFAVRLIAEEHARGTMYKGNATTNTRYCPLVPIFMSAHKEHNGVMYEEWDKTDPLINYVVGCKLWNDIQPWLNSVADLRETTRDQCLNAPSGRKKATDWLLHNVKYGIGKTLKGSDMMRYIYFQCWVANVVHRNQYMILDTMNWDNIPEPLDEQVVRQEEQEEYIDDMPF